ncbi:MAG: hypothetical protein M9896_18800 [Candidatus Promineofilum sp.]|uniref:hypothetical protein n=1 Tax=Promineifilum sp. TaxID=2664178 RepID=UPI00241210CA|nr:hypothetical protein [Promineifilum sp.]
MSDAVAPPPAILIDGMTGRRIGRYLIGERLGSGGVAQVYRAVDQVDRKDVALKLLPPSADAAALERFRREAITGGLRHPTLCAHVTGEAPTQERADPLSPWR